MWNLVFFFIGLVVGAQLTLSYRETVKLVRDWAIRLISLGLVKPKA